MLVLRLVRVHQYCIDQRIDKPVKGSARRDNNELLDSFHVDPVRQLSIALGPRASSGGPGQLCAAEEHVQFNIVWRNGGIVLPKIIRENAIDVVTSARDIA